LTTTIRHKRHLSNVRKGIQLEDAVTVYLQAMKTDGHIIRDFRLLNAAKYPDFYVRDSKGRDWLLEVKNIYLHRALTKEWFASNVFSKNWNARVYETGESYVGWDAETGKVRRIRDSITISSVRSLALVISHDWWTDEARSEVNTFFGDRVVVFDEQLRLGSQAYETLFFRLRDLFTG
jgi:hypothetical protein